MAPEEALGEILQVPLGCVTPLALVNESAGHVSLLLDQGFKSQDCCIFHPLSNDTSISLNTHDLDKFLRSIGRDPIYVDLEANPSVGKDQPPDLAALVPPDGINLPDLRGKAASSQDPETYNPSVNNMLTAATSKTVKPPNDPQKGKQTHTESLSSSPFADPAKFVEEILEKTSAIIHSEVKEENIKQHGEQLGVMLSNSLRKQLSLEFKNLATIFKNLAYTEGFHAGNHHQQKRLN